MNINWGEVVGGYPLKEWDWSKVETPSMPLGCVKAPKPRSTMTLTETLAPLVAHNDENVKNLAGLLADIDKALSLGQLTEQEYVNLMIIANNLKLVIEASTQQELLIMANQALKIVIEVAKTAKFI